MNNRPYCDAITPAPFWTSERTYVAVCQAPLHGDPVTATRTAKSYVSQEHADSLAAFRAERDAKGGLICCFRGEGSWTVDGVVSTEEAYSCLSQEEANNIAIRHAYVTAHGLEVSEHEAWLFNYRPVGSALLSTC